MTLRLPEELDAALERIAAQDHTSKHSVVLQAAESFVASRARRSELRGAIDFVRTHDAELLERLADA